MKNNFLLDIDQYQRHIDPIRDWIQQTALYASKMRGLPYERCVEHLRKKVETGEIVIDSPKVVHYERADNGDAHKTVTSLRTYINTIKKEERIVVPTLTTYFNPKVIKSDLVGFLDQGVAMRKKYKKLSQKYEAEGNKRLQAYFHKAQDFKKRVNNSASGAMVADGSVIKNTSGHSTLTSTIRSITSISNSSNERLIEGNRHYYAPKIALYNILSIISKSDFPLIDEVIQTYGLVYPTVMQTMECITRSTSLYFRDPQALDEINRLVNRLTPVERAAFVYTGDLYHLRVLNDQAIRTFITQLSKRGDATPVNDVRTKLRQSNEDFLNYAHQVCMSLMAGYGKDYEQLSDESCYILYNTVQNIIQTIERYNTFIKAFFLTKNFPATISTVPAMIRRTVVLSDTDSSMFSVDSWVKWYFNKLEFSDEGFAMAGSIMFMATQSIAHLLAMFSANMGVEKSRLHQLAMKPEFVFPVFAQTPVAKHYYTAQLVKEGNVFKDIKMEIKGVHMKDSTLPTEITEAAAGIMERNIRNIMKGQPVSIHRILYETITLERQIIDSVKSGSVQYLKFAQIKEASAYKLGPTQSPYQHYTLWEEVFKPFYGEIAAPPYQAVQIPLDLPSKTAMKRWLEQCPNKEFVEKFTSWFVRNEKSSIQTMILPLSHILGRGIPIEIAPIINHRKIVLALTKSYRNILGSLNHHARHEMMIHEQVFIGDLSHDQTHCKHATQTTP